MRAAIFDMDGLLLDSEPYWQEAERTAFARVGVELTDADLTRTVGMRIDEVAAHWFERRPWNVEVMPQARVVDEVICRVNELVAARGAPCRGALAAIELVADAGWRLALASSSPMRIIVPTLETLGLADRFEVVHSAQHEPRGKPDPGVYCTTLERLGCAAADCFALEDSVAGLRAARGAGLRCVAVPDPRLRGDAAFDQAFAVLDSLEDLDRELLGRLAAPSAIVGESAAQ